MSGHTATPDARGWENGARTKIIFHATLAHGDWWQVFNPANEMTLLARETDEARVIVDTLNSHADLVRALEAVVADINDYERVNNLAPNPGRTECWDSVARAKALLATLTARKVG